MGAANRACPTEDREKEKSGGLTRIKRVKIWTWDKQIWVVARQIGGAMCIRKGGAAHERAGVCVLNST